MYLAINQRCPLGLSFAVPHKPEPMTAKRIIKKFPHFAKIFDGQGEENTLRFYYKKSKETGIYEFIDLDAEEEVAELMGVKIKTFDIKDEIDKPLDEKDVENFREHMSDIRNGLLWLRECQVPTMERSSCSEK
jgi:hypothetical protein